MVAAGYALSCSEGTSGGHGASTAAMAAAPSERERQRERVLDGVRVSGREARRALWCSTTSSKAQGAWQQGKQWWGANCYMATTLAFRRTGGRRWSGRGGRQNVPNLGCFRPRAQNKI